jgi:chemotaxis protein methyltransferase CheR
MAAIGPGPREFEYTDRDFKVVCDLIRKRVGIALTDSKRDMVYSRLTRRLRTLGLSNFEDYLAHLQRQPQDDEEWQQFTNALTTNLTSFFREGHHFEILAEQLGKLKAKGGHVDLWCCAASTGEEPYSILITACEVWGTLKPPVRLWATDVDTQVLETGSRGVYPFERIAGLSEERKKKFFLRGTGGNDGLVRVKPALRELVEFQTLNLLDAGYPRSPEFAAVFCRNVMIYFDKPMQREILSKIVQKMGADSLLYTGHSENYMHASDIVAACGRSLYRRASAAGGAGR